MQKIWTVIVLGLLIVAGLGLWSYSQAEAAPKERHPLIHKALHQLREARKNLKEAAHIYNGHREHALKDTDHAIHQLEEALAYAGKK